jgi:hypothetical protein
MAAWHQNPCSMFSSEGHVCEEREKILINVTAQGEVDGA